MDLKKITKLLNNGIDKTMPKDELRFALYDDNKVIFTDTKALVVLDEGDEIKAHFKDLGGNFYDPKSGYFMPLAGKYPEWKRIVPDRAYDKKIKLKKGWILEELIRVLIKEGDISFNPSNKTIKAYLEYIKGEEIIISIGKDNNIPFTIKAKDSFAVVMPVILRENFWEVM